uniref:DUF5047 domain-containing protein n=1 Tax=Micromonospora acroterricola TaxID=2202421 RepID=UPI001F442D42|nr:DUF5047 domain-containing protein [Micromonospora acroterricola]
MFEARVVPAGLTGVNPPGTAITIEGGDVQIDGTAQIRSTLEMTTEGAGMWPTRASDLLAPYGNELFVRRGIRYGNGTTEWVSLGYHRIYTPEQDRAPHGPIRVMGRDRMSGIVDGRLTAPRPFAASATYGSVVSTLVGEIYPWATIEWDESGVRDTPIGRQVIAEEDRYKVLDELVSSVGKVWWWDHRGVLVIRTPPTATQPVWEVNHGANGVLVSLSRRLTREGVYNAVVATGEGADTTTPVRAVVVDSSPTSPTNWWGSFGKVPRFFSSPFITSLQQARNAAAAMLAKQLGLPYAVDFTAVPNPALEPYDPIRVTYPGRSELHVIDRLTIALTVGAPVTASTREQTSVLIGEL